MTERLIGTDPAPAAEEQEAAPEGPGAEEGAASPSDARRAARRKTAALLGALVVLAFLLRLEGLRLWFWTDEGLSVGIASHPLGDIPELLRRDGSPPLYYLLLHLWMGWFGQSEVATHVLSLVFGLALVPVAFWAGRSLFDQRVGWFAAVLAAANPFLARYSTETRMYALAALLGLVVTATYVHAFALGRTRYLPAFSLSLAALLYTHNWGLFLAAGGVVGLVPCLVAAPDRRRLLRNAALAFGAAGLVYLPWVPILRYQARHTGAPFLLPPVARDLITALSTVLGDERVLVALVLVAGGALLAGLRRVKEPEGAALAAAVAVPVAGLFVAWSASHFNPAWADRYFSIFAPAVVLVAAYGLARARSSQALLALGLILLFWTHPLGRITGLRKSPPRNTRSQVGTLARLVEPHLRPGDIVVAVQMEELPVIHYYLSERVPGLRYANPLGLVEDPRVVDWRDAPARMRATSPPRGLEPLVAALPTGNRLLVVCPGIPRALQDIVPWFRLMGRRCDQWVVAMAADTRVERLPMPAVERAGSNDFVRLYRKLERPPRPAPPRPRS